MTRQKPYDPIEQAWIEGLASQLEADRRNEEPDYEVFNHKFRNDLNTNFEQDLQQQETETMSPSSEPFYPSANSDSKSYSEGKVAEAKQSSANAEEHLEDQAKQQITNNATTLQFQTYAMRAQHQYIQNLQRANTSLKAKISYLEDQLGNVNEGHDLLEQIASCDANFQNHPPPVEDRMESCDAMEDMNMVSIGRLGEANKFGNDFRQSKQWNGNVNKRNSHKNDYGADRGFKNRGNGDDTRQGNS